MKNWLREHFRDIVVLEDTHERVDWLRAMFPGVHIRHAGTVVEFLKEIRAPHALVILDHDLAGELGDSPEAAAVYDRGDAGDAFGLTGMDAARACGRHTPVVVWSANPVWGPRMRDALDGWGVPVVQYPFRADLNMAYVIREAYFTATGEWLNLNGNPVA